MKDSSPSPIDLYGLLGLVADEPRVGATVREMACRAAAARLASSSSSAEELTSDVGGGQQAVDEHEIERLTAKQVKTFSDATYNLYPLLGLSLSFHPLKRRINQVDLTSPVPPLPTASPSTASAAVPLKPLGPFALSESLALPHPLQARSDLLELLHALGEPSRKGGGLDNVGRLGPGVWVEWEDLDRSLATVGATSNATKGETAATSTAEGAASAHEAALGPKRNRRGLYVEFEVRGAGCWERSALEGERWKSATLFVS